MSLDLDFELDDARLKTALDNVRRYAAYPRKVITSALFVLDRKIRDSFQAQQSPYGKKWAELKIGTIRGRRRRGINRNSILLATAQLFRSLDRQVTSDNRGVISIGTDERPVAPHQFGVPQNNLPARPIMPIKPPGVVSLPREWQRDINRELQKGLDEVQR